MNKSQRIYQVANSYRETFGDEPAVWARAPGRVDLMGSHTDYNLGYVLTQAIDRDTWIAATPRTDERVNLRSLNVTGTVEFSIEDITYDETAKWSNYVRAVLSIFQDEGYPVTGFNALIHSTIPISSGLSSSAAIEVATGVLLSELGGFTIEPLQLAILCQRAENDFVGMNCGILDQYSSVFGRAGEVLMLDCRDLTSATRPVAPGIQLVICDTRAIRELTGSEYTERRAQCEQGVQLLKNFLPDINSLRDVSIDQFETHVADLPDVVARRCRFVIEENQRVLDMADALADGNLAEINRLSAASFLGAQTLYEISSLEMDEMMAAMRSGPGVIAARQAGAGFGGCMAAFVESDCTQAFQWHVSQRYRHSTGIKPQVYPVQASPGAGLLSL
jgi:galactokinase